MTERKKKQLCDLVAPRFLEEKMYKTTEPFEASFLISGIQADMVAALDLLPSLSVEFVRRRTQQPTRFL